MRQTRSQIFVKVFLELVFCSTRIGLVIVKKCLPIGYKWEPSVNVKTSNNCYKHQTDQQTNSSRGKAIDSHIWDSEGEANHVNNDKKINLRLYTSRE